MATAPTEGTTVRRFLELLHGADLLSADDWRALETHWPDVKRDVDAAELARALVAQRVLTKHQAASLYQQRPKGLGIAAYVFLDRLGTGGSGSVYKARHRKSGDTTAVKVLNLSGSRSADALKRFQREAETAARLNHPNIVRALESGESGGQYYTVMEFVAGTDLSTYVKQQGPLAYAQAAQCVVDAARALAYAHEQGIIHRDIKPANLMLCTDGKIKVLDMGLARLQDPSAVGNEQAAEGLTQTGQVMGTVDYMAPEQALHTRLADARADVYSLGCTFYRLATGDIPYDGDSMVAKILAHREHPIPSLRKKNPKIPPAFDVILQRMLAKKPEDRYQTMHEAADDLQRALQGVPVAPLKQPINLPQATVVLDGDSHSTSLTSTFGHGAQGAAEAAAEQARPRKSMARRRTPVWAVAGVFAVAAVAVGAGGWWVMNRDGVVESEDPPLEIALLPTPRAMPSPSPTQPAPHAVASASLPTSLPSATTTEIVRASPPSTAPVASVPVRNATPSATASPRPSPTAIAAASSSTPPMAPAAALAGTSLSSMITATTSGPAPLPSPTSTATATTPFAVTAAPAAAPTAPKRLPVPETKALDEALKVVRGELHKEAYAAAKKPEDRVTLGRALYTDASQLQDDPVGRYALLREARDLGAEGGDLSLTLAAADEAEKAYEVESLVWLAEACEAAQKKGQTRSVCKSTAEGLLPKVDEALKDERFDVAERLMVAALSAMRKASDTATTKAVVERNKRFDVEKKQYAEAVQARSKLQDDPDDPAANLALGKYLCFARAQWDDGLAALAKGNDAALKELAEQSIPAPTNADDLAALADSWWAKGEKAPRTVQKDYWIGALHWYEQAAPQITGLSKSRIDKRIADARTALGIGAPPPPTVASAGFMGAAPPVNPGVAPPPQGGAGGDVNTQNFIQWVFARNGYLYVRYAQGSRFAYTPADLTTLGAYSVFGARFRSSRGANLTDADFNLLTTVPWLTSLLFERMPITDAQVARLASMPALRELSLIGCPQVTDAGVVALAKLPQLTVLDLSSSNITDQSLAVLGRLAGLQSLNLSNCRVKDAGIAQLSALPRLSVLDLSITGATDESLAVLGRMVNLQSLSLSSCRVTDVGLSQLQNLRELDSLNLSNSGVTDAGLVHLSNCTDLDSLYLSGTQITGQGLAALANCRDLDVLYLYGTKLNDAGLEAVSRLTSLFYLSVYDTQVTDAGVAKLVTLTNLSTFDVSGCRVTDASAPVLARFPRLTFLRIGRTGISPQAVQAIQSQLPNCRITTN